MINLSYKFFILTLIYFWIFLNYWYYWTKIPKLIGNFNEEQISSFISVILAVRNEENTIINLLQSLEQQRYNKSIFEVIIIDDFSTDTTYEKILNFNSELNITVEKAIGKGKKNAINQAIKLSKGSIILQTDGDCVVPKEWILNYSNVFLNPRIQFVSGPVVFFDGNWFSKFQNYEFLGLIGIGAASISMRRPGMSNGANLGYRKLAFEAVEGFKGNEHIASGDDEFLLRKIAFKFPESILFLKNNKSIVKTQAQSLLSDFLNQRVRWASKWKQHSFSLMTVLPIFIFIYYITMIFGLVILINELNFIILFSLFLKIIIESVFMLSIFSFFERRKLIFYIFVMQLIYPFYTIFIALFSFKKNYTWKSRKVN